MDIFMGVYTIFIGCFMLNHLATGVSQETIHARPPRGRMSRWTSCGLWSWRAMRRFFQCFPSPFSLPKITVIKGWSMGIPDDQWVYQWVYPQKKSDNWESHWCWLMGILIDPPSTVITVMVIKNWSMGTPSCSRFWMMNHDVMLICKKKGTVFTYSHQIQGFEIAQMISNVDRCVFVQFPLFGQHPCFELARTSWRGNVCCECFVRMRRSKRGDICRYQTEYEEERERSRLRKSNCWKDSVVNN